jgi:hypothetical protein
MLPLYRIGEGKGKGHPRTGHEGPKGEQMYSCTVSLTSAIDDVGVQSHGPANLPLGKYPVLIAQEVEWGPVSVWTGEENFPPTGLRSLDRPGRSESLY